ncbi:hypothetical protein KBY85_05235 [Cyanobium sp. BA5m-10]|uniref:hypothetical protein n=1 Tax=Cyanobium sp. BA5m-10 TaxID=2823705 RepID=UPI0020CFD0E6|nr:hypothetical protein [Cyanobium sp. BA5m-10]MCP9903541.1 hypothetical protein [Cyanobium sp. BA5m-10]
MSPTWTPDQKGVKVQIVDVFALELATGYSKDPEGRLLLSSEPSVSSGRTWSLAKACQLVRNDRRPERWVVLHRHKKAWGLFWVGGGLDQSRAALTAAMGIEQTGGALVPATPEALLRLILTLEEPEVEPVLITKIKKEKKTSDDEEQSSLDQGFPWKAVAITSAVWLAALGVLGASLTSQLQQQDLRLQQLIERLDARPVSEKP